MNSYRFNGLAGAYFRALLCRFLNIESKDIYKTVRNVLHHEDDSLTIITKDKKYKIEIKEII